GGGKKKNILQRRRVRLCLYRCINSLLVKANWVPWKIDWTHDCYKRLNFSQFKMVIGMDVCHNRVTKSSVVAFTSTYDSDMVKLHQIIGYQKMGVELVKTIAFYFKKALKKFRSCNDKYPEQIFFYRDGVSESQLETIAEEEVCSLRKVLEEEKIKCKIEFIIVQKREDSGSIPSRYIVIADEMELINKKKETKNKENEDEEEEKEDKEGKRALQTFSSHLCHLYFDSTQDAVRIPHVVKAADHIAFKFSNKELKDHLQGIQEERYKPKKSKESEKPKESEKAKEHKISEESEESKEDDSKIFLWDVSHFKVLG
ncbi:aubergine protein, partial [Reticulomyxa filosa]